ncbi:methyltransferase domain-containing protein [Streptomyces sp. NPDC059949]|uniref:methyltransferase domain-containing protein n=1 Tax=Streptomyces sp. NPDC059949 TaxID=3347013 RepID=UPI00364D1EA3
MTVVILQHTPGAGRPPARAIGAALEAAGLDVRIYGTGAGGLPDDLTGVDALVVTDGPEATCSAAGRDEGCAGRGLTLVRGALAAEVPVLGVCRGAQLLAVAAGGGAHPAPDVGAGREPLGLTPAAASDPLFAGAPEQPQVPQMPSMTHLHGGSVELPAKAVVLAADHHRRTVQAFRIGASAWGLRFPLEADADSDAVDAEPWQEHVLARFAELVAARAEHTATRAFFTQRAGAWEDRFAYQTPAYEAAVARMELRRGQTALDLGCGTGRAMPALRAQVGSEGSVLGVDVTQAMLTAAARVGRTGAGQLLLADCTRLPLPAGSVHGIFAAGLLDHLPRPRAALREWARVSAADGTLLLFHPAGRAERAARHGRPLSPDDPLAEPNLRPVLDATGWQLAVYDDAAQHFLAHAVRTDIRLRTIATRVSVA